MNLRTGDILCYGAGKRPGLATLTRIFAPEDKKFRLAHLRNAFNCDYCVHVNQAVEIDGRMLLRDTWARLRMISVDEYMRENKARDRTLLGIYRLPAYDCRRVREGLQIRSVRDMLSSRVQRRWYDVGGVIADYVPLLGNIVRNKTDRKYCSERVRDDVLADTLIATRLAGHTLALPPRGTCSPETLRQWARGNCQTIAHL